MPWKFNLLSFSASPTNTTSIPHNPCYALDQPPRNPHIPFITGSQTASNVWTYESKALYLLTEDATTPPDREGPQKGPLFFLVFQPFPARA